MVQSGEGPPEKPQVSEKKISVSSSESAKRVSRTVKPSVAAASKVVGQTGSIRKKMEPKINSDSGSGVVKSTVTGSGSGSARSPNSVPIRRNSTGGLPEKPSVSVTKRPVNVGSVATKKTSTLASDPLRRSLPEIRRSSLPSVAAKTSPRASISETRKSGPPVSPVTRSLRTSTESDVTKKETIKRSSVKSASSISSSSKRATSSLDSSGSSTLRKVSSKLFSPSARSPAVTSGSKVGSLSSSMDRSSSFSGRRKAATPEGRDSRFIVLPQVEIKAGDDVVSK